MGLQAWCAWGCRPGVRGVAGPGCVGLQAGVRARAGGCAAPASVKKATKTGVDEMWRSCRKSLREEVKLTMVKPATMEITRGWCQLLPKVAVSQCSACGARARARFGVGVGVMAGARARVESEGWSWG